MYVIPFAMAMHVSRSDVAPSVTTCVDQCIHVTIIVVTTAIGCDVISRVWFFFFPYLRPDDVDVDEPLLEFERSTFIPSHKP